MLKESAYCFSTWGVSSSGLRVNEYMKMSRPECLAKPLRRSFFPFTDFATINDYVVFAGRTVDPDGAEGKLVEAHMRLHAPSTQALFFEVRAEKGDQRCSTSLLPQCGHRTSPSS
jgi:hypothetical protein